MGCDIHAHIECQRYTSRGEFDWIQVAVLPFLPRHYHLFGALTNGEVRGDPMPDSPPLRGLPDDADYDTRDLWDKDDGHSPSWVTGPELSRAVLWAENTDPIWNAVVAAMQTLDVGGFPSRLVFWFDN